jgi:HAD superfamily phosphoserine phosphatase-like hydrolase
MKTLALFDFDGTLYKKDSLIEFTKFAKGNFAFYIGIIKLIPNLIGLKLGLLANEKVKIKYFTFFFKNLDIDIFKKISSDYALEKIHKDLDPEIFSKLQHHIESKDTVYIVTATFPELIACWSSQYKLKVIGTKLEVKNNTITGQFASKNCYGIEKVNRINQAINLHEFDFIHVYGSGKGDKEMLQLSKNFIS